jgi:hypothetical protein
MAEPNQIPFECRTPNDGARVTHDIERAIRHRHPLLYELIQFLINAHVRFCYPSGRSDNSA